MTAMTTPRHQVASATAQLRDVADALVDASVWSMDCRRDRVDAGGADPARGAGRRAEVPGRGARRRAPGRPRGRRHQSTANWLAHTTKQTRPAAARTVRLGYDLATHDLVRDALAHGDLRVEQAQVIIRAVKALPDDLDPDLVIQAERHLVAAARRPRRPDPADPRPPAAGGRGTRPGRRPRGRPAREGRGQGRAGDPADDDRRRARQDPRPVHPAHRAGRDAEEDAARDRRPQAPGRHPRARVCSAGRGRSGWAGRSPSSSNASPPSDLPKVGGTDATIVVTIDLDTLTGKLQKAGVLDTGERISPGQARRLACTARIIPVVLDGTSEVLDVGRARRFFTRAQLLAMAVRDGGCVAEGCDWPPWLCHGTPLDPLDRRRRHRPRQRRTPLPQTPRPSPRPDLRDDPTTERQGQLPPTVLGRRRRCLHSADVGRALRVGADPFIDRGVAVADEPVRITDRISGRGNGIRASNQCGPRSHRPSRACCRSTWRSSTRQGLSRTTIAASRPPSGAAGAR